jgi:hypothetical protein
MAAPLLVPLILLGGATVALAAASSKKKVTPLPAPPQNGGGGRSYTLDANIPPPVRDQVLAALTGENDPARLEGFAAVLQPSYPLAATALRTKAAMLRPPQPVPYPSVPSPLPPTPAPTPPPVPIPPAPSPDWQTQLMAVPDPPRSDVIRQLMGQNDPAALEAYARTLDAQYPIAAWALRVREAALRGMAPPPEPAPQPTPPAMPVPLPIPPTPPIQPAPAPTPSPSPSPIPIPPVPSILGGLDLGMPTEMQKAVVGALTTESDPAKLEGFASAIQGQYPISAGLLMAKAEALRLTRPVVPSPIPSPPSPKPSVLPPVPSPSPSPSPSPVPTSGTYTVLSGDFPIKIAQKLVHDGGRWKELIAANPNKKRAADGNFASLLPGEVLHLPASWVDTNAAKAPVLSLPMGGNHAPHA